jgi:hypothetical protein
MSDLPDKLAELTAEELRQHLEDLAERDRLLRSLLKARLRLDADRARRAHLAQTEQEVAHAG